MSLDLPGYDLLSHLRVLTHDLLSRRKLHPEVLVAEKIFESDRLRLAVGADFLSLIIPISQPKITDFDEQLRNIRVTYNARINLAGDECAAIIVRTNDLSNWLVDLFLQALSILTPGMCNRTDDELVRIVRSLIDLFRGLDGSQRKSALGLWGELFCIATAVDPTAAIESWHPNPVDRYDFSNGDCRLEIKTTTGVRLHHFGYEQLRPHADIEIYIGSIITEESADGISIGDLIEEICSHDISPRLQTRLVNISMKTLGRSWAYESLRCFNREVALHSFRFFEGGTVPCVDPPPPEISELHFVADLQSVPAIDARVDGSLGLLSFCRMRNFSSTETDERMS